MSAAQVDTRVETRNQEKAPFRTPSNVITMTTLLEPPLKFSDHSDPAVVNVDVQQLAQMIQNGKLSQVASIIQLLAEAAAKKSASATVDTSVDPKVPTGMQLDHHDRTLGTLDFNRTEVTLYLSPNQKNHRQLLSGDQLLHDLSSQQVLNAVVLDYLLLNQQMIPQDWKGCAVAFWGSIYRHKGDFSFMRHVRCLLWRNDAWCSEFRPINGYWRFDRPAAVLT